MKKKTVFTILAVFILAAVIAVAVFMDRDKKEEAPGYSPTADKYNAPNVIFFNGQSYEQDKALTTVLFIGVDDYGPVKESPVFYNEGQADFLMLGIFDKRTESVRLLHINRDTMTPVRRLVLGGKSAGSAEMQIALAHTYGKGLQDSCLNTELAVSTLLSGTDIDFYFAMNMDGVALLNDEVGGVTVTIEDEFRGNDDFVVGETITLQGEQALTYVRGRSSVADGSNVNRMKRQRDYIQKFVANFERSAQNLDFINTAIKLIAEYSVTDMPLEKLSEIAGLFSEYELESVSTIEGDFSYENEFVEFYPDPVALTEQLVDLLYLPANKE